MARFRDPYVGQHVYKSFSPQKAGVIVWVDPTLDLARVKWLNGTEEIRSTLGLADFDSLIEDHQKKLNTHLATRERLEAL